jgi:hypothetical protein
MAKPMNIHVEKLWLIEQLTKLEDEALLQQIKSLILLSQYRSTLPAMTQEQLASKIEDSQADIVAGNLISQDELKEKIRSWTSK